MRDAWRFREDTQARQVWGRVLIFATFPDNLSLALRKGVKKSASKMWAGKENAESYSQLRDIDLWLRPNSLGERACSHTSCLLSS